MGCFGKNLEPLEFEKEETVNRLEASLGVWGCTDTAWPDAEDREYSDISENICDIL